MTSIRVADWLNTTFSSFDYAGLQFFHSLAESGAYVLTPLAWFFDLIGEFGCASLVLALILILFKKTRRLGVCVLLALCIGALFTNLILKNLIARPRPFEDARGIYYSWWLFVGALEETSSSFPSGHTTAAMASMTVIFLSADKRFSWLVFLYPLVMGLSRSYLMVHYPSDVIAGFLVGLLAALIAWGIMQMTSGLLKKRAHTKQTT